MWFVLEPSQFLYLAHWSLLTCGFMKKESAFAAIEGSL
jgi:hypothetical protein